MVVMAPITTGPASDCRRSVSSSLALESSWRTERARGRNALPRSVRRTERPRRSNRRPPSLDPSLWLTANGLWPFCCHRLYLFIVSEVDIGTIGGGKHTMGLGWVCSLRDVRLTKRLYSFSRVDDS